MDSKERSDGIVSPLEDDLVNDLMNAGFRPWASRDDEYTFVAIDNSVGVDIPLIADYDLQEGKIEIGFGGLNSYRSGQKVVVSSGEDVQASLAYLREIIREVEIGRDSTFSVTFTRKDVEDALKDESNAKIMRDYRQKMKDDFPWLSL